MAKKTNTLFAAEATTGAIVGTKKVPVKKPTKTAKPTPIEIELKFKVGVQQIKNLLSEAIATIEEEYDIPKCPISLDYLRGDKVIMATVNKLARQQLMYTLGSLDENSDVVQDLADAIVRKHRPAIEEAEAEAEALRKEQVVDLQIPRKNAEAAKRLLREKGLL